MNILSPHIRGVCEADFALIAALTNRYIARTAIHFGYEPVTPDELAASWTKHAHHFPFLVAEIQAPGSPPRFAGYAKAGTWRERAAYQWTAEVGIYVEDDFHRAGVGRALYARLLEELTRRGFHSAIGGVTLPNAPSVRLHESLGFVHVGTVRQAGWKHGAWHDVAFYQILLRDAHHRVTPAGPTTP
ncbi:MAG: N-acetyltransferase family protein [Phycisphaerales bacterium]